MGCGSVVDVCGRKGGKNVKGLNGIKGQCAHRKKTQAGERALAKQKQK